MSPFPVRIQSQGNQRVLSERPTLRLHRNTYIWTECNLYKNKRRASLVQDHGRYFPKPAARLYHTHAIEDKNVLRFHVDYFKPKETGDRRADGTLKKQAVVDAILSKHDAATHSRRFNAILATASINEAIEYYELFRSAQESLKQQDENYEPLNIACVFSPPAEGNKDIQQIQEDQ